MPIVYFIGFRTDRPPFDNIEIRRAFAQVLDRQKLRDDLWNDGSAPATSMVPPAIWPDGRSWYREIGLYTDTTQSDFSQNLSTGFDGLIRLAVPTGTERMAQLLREQWQARLGIVIAIEVYDRAQFDLILDNDKSQMYFGGWYADYASPYIFLGDGIEHNSRWLRWSNDAYSELINTARFETDVNRQIELYVQAERMLTEQEAVIAPLFHDLFFP